MSSLICLSRSRTGLLGRGRAAIASGVFFAALALGGAASAEPVCGQDTYYDGLEAWNTGDHTSALSIWEHTANRGDVRSQLRLGQLYRDGAVDVVQNYVESHKWFNLGANNTLLECSGPLNNREAREAKDDARDARDRLEDLMTFDNISEAQQLLSETYLCQRTSDSVYQLAVIHHTGSGVPANKVSACAYYNVAAAEGVADAQIALQQITAVMDKNEIAQCQSVARTFARPSVSECGRIFGIGQCVGGLQVDDINRQAALRALGLYDGPLDGDFGPMSREAVKRFQRSLREPATGDLGETQVCSLIQSAAEKGDPTSLLTLGHMYYEGIGFPQNDKQARYLFQQAADFGLPSAAYNLGMMYIEGRGVGRDYVRGCNYLRTAKAKGHPDASDSLNQYCPNSR